MPTSTPTYRTISWHDRSWINRELQQFCGRYRLDEASGLYFDPDTPNEHRSLISRTFLQLPKPLRDAALYLGLTVSTSPWNATKYGAMSAVYGDWDRKDHSRISPHLEMSKGSLTAEFVLPHLVHECCHLFWAIQSISARIDFVDDMIFLIGPEFEEVTEYAQGFYDEWQKLVQSEGVAIVQRRLRAQEKWVVEAFCESVAKICAPSYKSSEGRDSRTLLQERRTLIAANFNFSLDQRRQYA